MNKIVIADSEEGARGMSDLPKLASPAQRALTNAGIQNLRQSSKFSGAEIRRLHGIGPNALSALCTALKGKSLSFSRKR